MFKWILLAMFLLCAFTLKAQTQTNLDSLQKQSEKLIYLDPVNSLKITDYIIQNAESVKTKSEADLVKAETYFLLKKYSLSVEQLIHFNKNLENSKHLFISKQILISTILDSLELKKQSSEILNELSKQKILGSDFIFRNASRDSSVSSKQLKELENRIENSSDLGRNDLLNKLRYRLAEIYWEDGKTDSADYYYRLLEQNPNGSYFNCLGKIGKATVLSEKGDFLESTEILQSILLSSDSPYKAIFLGEIHRLLAKNYFSTANMELYAENMELYAKVLEKEAEEKQKARVRILDLLQLDYQVRQSEWEKKLRRISGVSIGVLSVILVFIVIRIYKSKQKNRKILEAEKSREWMDASWKEMEARFQEEKHTPFIISERKESIILEKLQEFEDKKKYLNSKLSLASLAKELDSNTTYLSEIINKHKGKNFRSYVNELRIKYIVDKLKSDPEYRTYKISYLSEQAGFVSRTSFPRLFKAVTGVTPSDFIESLENKQE